MWTDRSFSYTSLVRITRLATSFPLLVALWAAAVSLTAAGAAPTPASVFGFEPGADYKLATYDQSIEYFKKLAASSRIHQARRGGQDVAGPDDDTSR